MKANIDLSLLTSHWICFTYITLLSTDTFPFIGYSMWLFFIMITNSSAVQGFTTAAVAMGMFLGRDDSSINEQQAGKFSFEIYIDPTPH